MEFPHLESVPAYWAQLESGLQVPFIISLKLYDSEGAPRLTPSVERSVDRTVALTERYGVAYANIGSTQDIHPVQKYMERVSKFEVPAIALFTCETPELAELLMTRISEVYEVTMIQDDSAQAETSAAV